MSIVINSTWSRLVVYRIDGLEPSMWALAIFGGTPLSVPWSVQYIFLQKNCLFRKHCRKSTVNNYNIMSLPVYIFHILKIGFPNTKSSEHRLGKEENIAAYLYLSVECRTIYTFFTVGSVTMGWYYGLVLGKFNKTIK